MPQESQEVPRPAPQPESTEPQDESTAPQGRSKTLKEVFYKYGRYYGSVKPEKYKFPIDEEEMARYDLFNKIFLMARNDAIFSYPMQSLSPRVMDLGGGTGIWSILLSDNYLPNATIQSVDLHRVQPPEIPPNVTMTTADIEEPSWETLFTDCDLIHMRLMLGAIHNPAWPHIYRKAFEHTTPGGYIEQVEIDWLPVVDGLNTPVHLLKWATDFLDAMDNFQQSARVNSERVRAMMEAAGYVNFQDRTIRLYLNPSTANPDVNYLARWFNACLVSGLHAMSLTPMIEGLGKTIDEVKALCKKAEDDTLVLEKRVYCVM
ncbi:methyltransferase LaeA [Cordyceps fumosorosea ARSEF 2679]|uniref:Methyltransferase LaeA n=1 Tax=Cordyceps fumosorosea (strain ARSEF 2679) TaxID=1081104 RepID=A0A167UFP2_CORFA|nr:methyltransferase LaeA [Cordyceps fumosorosea ARSEF 2679]OAA61539.1 methyltransferase LaeA [Cordyceps fumosorosea ARSEF 2679]